MLTENFFSQYKSFNVPPCITSTPLAYRLSPEELAEFISHRTQSAVSDQQLNIGRYQLVAKTNRTWFWNPRQGRRTFWQPETPKVARSRRNERTVERNQTMRNKERMEWVNGTCTTLQFIGRWAWQWVRAHRPDCRLRDVISKKTTLEFRYGLSRGSTLNKCVVGGLNGSI